MKALLPLLILVASPVQAQQTQTGVPVSPLMADRPVPGVAPGAEAHLDPANGHRLQAVTLGGRRYATGDDFPNFHVLDRQGRELSVPATDKRWAIAASGQTVTYGANGLNVEVRYVPERDRLNVVVSVLSEGEWKLVSVDGTPLVRTGNLPDDYLVDGSGWLVYADVPKVTDRQWEAQGDNLIGGQTPVGFVAWREKDRIVSLKPLTFSHWLGWTAKPVAPAGAKAKPYEDSFDASDKVKPVEGYRGLNVKVGAVPGECKEGKGSLKVGWASAAEGYGIGGVRKGFEAVNFTGKSFSVWVKIGTPDTCQTACLALYDTQGRRAEIRYAYHVKDWTRLTFTVGQKGDWGHAETDPGADLTKISAIEFFGQTTGGDQTAEILWDAFEEESSQAGTSARFALRGGLYFRPAETRIPETKLCHSSLALRLETAGDANKDGAVDWVDAGIAYRERYLKPHREKCARGRLRDGFRVYYPTQGWGSYRRAFEGLTQIDFADGIWWCKGVMAPAVERDGESHPYTVKLNPGMTDRLADFREAMGRAGQLVGIYYGHDYIALEQKDWPDEFVKRGPDNRPQTSYQSYNVMKYAKDNVRPVASGAMFRHYEEIIKVCGLRPGDPVMLDTFSAFARVGHHPEYPATPELETQAKHRIAEFLHDKGYIVAGEGLVEGLHDVVDYGAIAVEPEKWLNAAAWEKSGGVQHVPMLPVVYQGSAYQGACWYEMRGPRPNWAVGLVFGVGYWDWLGQGPAYAWTRYARYYFNQNLAWAQVADAKVRTVRRQGSRFTTAYDNGVEIDADIGANRWTLTKGGVRYDGFTPFSPRGAMAVLTPGPFEITLPGEHRLEVSPQQPFRDTIRFECVVSAGKTILRGNLGDRKWPIPIIEDAADGVERSVVYQADPVLVLRKAK